MSITQAMRNKKASTTMATKSKSKSTNKSKSVKGDGKGARFDSKSPWPEGTIITTVDGARGKVVEVDQESEAFTIRWDHKGVRKTILFEEWNDVMADLIETVEFPASPAGSMIEHVPGSTDVGKLDIKTTKPPHADLVMVRIDEIDATHNVRTDMDEPFLLQLQASIADVGLLQPVVVRQLAPGEVGAHGWAFRMIAGHQRLEAARRAGETHVEAKLYKHVDDVWEAKARLAENVQRDDLNHIELAAAFGQAADAGMTVKEIAEQSHVSDDHVRRHLALRRLCPSVADLTARGRLPVQQAELIARVGDPAEQIFLAESATRLVWDAKARKWLARDGGNWRGGKYVPRTAAVQDADDRDFIKPMENLRKAVAVAMRGLAACGWPMEEKYAGKRACDGCPDNTRTYADQPMLFEGIKPEGSAKRGHCTNAACYETKRGAWDKVLAAKRKQREAEQKKTVAKAEKAGLAICAACGKVIPDGEAVEAVGQKYCPKCAEKAKKRGDGGGGGSWEARKKRVEDLEKRFPWTPEQKLAVAMHTHGQTVVELIAAAIADGTAGSDGNCVCVAEMVLWAQGAAEYLGEIPQDCRPTVQQVTGPGIPDADLAAWWLAAARWAAYMDKPGVGHDGKVWHVPLPAGYMERIADLERIAAACDATAPERPVAEEEVDNGQGTVDSAAKPAAGKKKKRKEVRAEGAEGAEKDKSGKAVDDEPFFCTRDCHGCIIGCAMPGDRHEQMRLLIVSGKKTVAEPAIERCADLVFLKDARADGLKGDWRRAAVASRIDDLREDLDVAGEHAAMRVAASESGELTDDENLADDDL